MLESALVDDGINIQRYFYWKSDWSPMISVSALTLPCWNHVSTEAVTGLYWLDSLNLMFDYAWMQFASWRYRRFLIEPTINFGARVSPSTPSLAHINWNLLGIGSNIHFKAFEQGHDIQQLPHLLVFTRL